MRPFLFLLLGYVILLPVYPQGNAFLGDHEEAWEKTWGFDGRNAFVGDGFDMDSPEPEKPPPDPPPKLSPEKSVKKPAKEKGPKDRLLTRKLFETGIDAGFGIYNGLVGTKNLFQKDIMLELNKINSEVDNDGININAGLLSGFLFNIRPNSKWGFGFFLRADGDLNINIPKSFFKLISQGNIKQHYFSDSITAKGGIFGNAGIDAYARFGNLRIGLRPAVFLPLVFIPKTGMRYHIETEDKIVLGTSGEIKIYSPLFDVMDNGANIMDTKSLGINYGADLALEAEYALFPFINLGAAVSNIPLIPAKMQNGLRYSLRMLNENGEPIEQIEITSVFDSKVQKLPKFEFKDEKGDLGAIDVYRLLRFNTYARFLFLKDSIALKQNIGFSYSLVDNEAYFNTGLEARFSLIELLTATIATNYHETIWNYKLGLAINIRLIELNMEAFLRSQAITDILKAKGFGATLGLRFGL